MAQLFRKSSIERLSSPEQLDKALVITAPLSWLALLGLALIIICFVIWSVCGSMPSAISARGVISNGVCTNSIYSSYAGTVSEVCVSEGDNAESMDVLCKIEDENGVIQEICTKEKCKITKLFIKAGDKVNYSDEIIGVSPVSLSDSFVVFYVDVEKIPSIRSGMEVIVNMPSFDNQKYGHMTGEVVLYDNFATGEDSIRRVVGKNEDVISYLEVLNHPVAAVTCALKRDDSSGNGFYWSNEKGKSLTVNVGSPMDAKIVIDESAPITRLIPELSR